jgi:hypothetical protein
VIVEVPIRPEFSKWAAEKCGDHIHGSAYHNVPNKFKANNTFCGYIAEAAWWSQHPDAQHVNVSEYDFLTKKGTRIDVKGIQSRYPPPALSFYRFRSRHFSQTGRVFQCDGCLDQQ